MDIEILGFIGFALLAASLARMLDERRLDVLYGPYLKGRAGGPAGLSIKQRRKSADTALDRFRSLEGSRRYQLASTVVC
jgi:hypothetical protein